MTSAFPVQDRALLRNARLSRIGTVIGAALLLSLPLLQLLGSAGADPGGTLLGMTAPPPDAAARWRMALVSLLPVGGGLYALYQLWVLFGEYRLGRVFGLRAQQALSRFAAAVLVWALALPVMRALMTLAATLGLPPGQRLIALSLYWHDGLLVLLGLVLVAISRAMLQARRLAEDNAGFV